MKPLPKILLVEDNLEIRETIKIWLELEGYEVDEAEDGLVALERLRVGAKPQLILLDMLMPKMTGWEFVEHLKRESPPDLQAIPIVALTATSEKLQKTPAEIQGVLRKPFELTALERVLHRFAPKD